MEGYYNKYKDKGIVFLNVSIDEDVSKWQEALVKHKLEWAQGRMEGGLNKVYEMLGIKSIPYVIIVGKDGKIAASLDFSTKDKLEAELKLLMN